MSSFSSPGVPVASLGPPVDPDPDTVSTQALFAHVMSNAPNLQNLSFEEKQLWKSNAKLVDAVNRTRNGSCVRQPTQKLQEELDMHMEKAAQARELNICFLLDGTGSMKPWMDNIRCQLLDWMTQYRTFHGSKLRVGIVVYRDYGLQDQLQVKEFDLDAGELIHFLDSVEASTIESAGEDRDEPEDVAGGLKAVETMDWANCGSGSSRVVIHICDAPAHGAKYNGGFFDRFADHNHSKCGNPLESLKKLSSMNVLFYSLRLTANTDIMNATLNKELGFPYIQILDIINPEELCAIVLRAFFGSVAKTFDASGGGVCKLFPDHHKRQRVQQKMDKKYEIKPLNRDLPMPIRDATFSACYPIQDDSDLKKAFASGYIGDHKCQIWPDPFAEGKCRWAFYGLLKGDDGTWQPHIFKQSKPCPFNDTRIQYLKQVHSSTVAVYMAAKWNEQKPAHLKKISYLPAFVAEVKVNDEPDLYCVEVEVQGTFVKYCNNVGWWDIVQAAENETLLEFVKFTHSITGGYLMIVDIQGIKTDKEYILTDPVVLCSCIDLFQPTNMGPGAMQAHLNQIGIMLREKFGR